MSLTVMDAYGRPVEELGICTRCGAFIKYIYSHDGKTYGSTCIEAVSGIHPDKWVLKDGRYDEAATRQSLAEKEAVRQERITKDKALDEMREGIREANRTRYAELINVLNNASRYDGDFCSEMARTIANDGFSTELCDILSYRMYAIVRDIWAKTYGRSGSKAYNAGAAEFDEKFHGETAQ